MKKLPLFLLVLMLSSLAFSSPQAPTWQAKVDPWLLDALSQGQSEFLVSLSEQADLSAAGSLRTKAEKAAYVYERLSETAERTQRPLIDMLQARRLAYRPFWIANMIWVRGDLAAVQALAERREVAHIYANPPIRVELPEPTPSVSPTAPASIEWNIQKVRAPDVWAAGVSGAGAVIAGQDTGYQWDHPALKKAYRGWDGAAADHNYNWHDAIHSGGGSCGADSPIPCDDHWHGTHTMGTMVGDDGGSNQIGMAPGARWIGCRNMDQGVGTPATYTECFQWFVAPTDLNGQNPRPDLAPDVINNSWSCPPSEGCNWDSLQSAVDNTRAAGIAVVVSAGNSGSACSSVQEPPAIYASSFSVGATDGGDLIAGFSSRGPSASTGLMKPNVSAPGVSVRSSTPGGYGGASGTSMASPHVSGLAALLISARPDLRGQVDRLQQVIEQSAVPLFTQQSCGGVSGAARPNNTFGWGRIDAWSAYQATLISLTLNKKASLPVVEPLGLLTYTLTISNTNLVDPANNLVLSDVLPAGATFIDTTQPYTLTGSQVEWQLASLAPGASWIVTLTVRAPDVLGSSLENLDYHVHSDEVPQPVAGSPVYTPVGYLYRFPLIFTP